MCLVYLIINKTQVEIEKMKGKYGIKYELASAPDGPCPHGGGPRRLKMEFSHLRFSTLTTAGRLSTAASLSVEWMALVEGFHCDVIRCELVA